MVRRVLFIIAFIMGGVILEGLLRLGGAPATEDLDPANMPACQPGQTIDDGCLPSEYAQLRDNENATKDLAEGLGY